MNNHCRKTLLSLVSTGLFKNKCHIRKSSFSKLIHRHKATLQAPPVKKVGIPPTFGQPTHLTHPHRIKKGEIVPGITKEELIERRARLLDNIKSFCCSRESGSKSLIIVIPSACKKYMTEKIPYVFRQNSDFLYLTGCLEQDCLLVLTANESRSESVLFLRGKDPQSELWDGPRTGVEQAVPLFGVDKAMPMREVGIFIEGFMRNNKDCVLWYDYLNDVHPAVHKMMQRYLIEPWNKAWESPRRFIHQLRLFKSPAEQELMKKSCEIGSEAIKMAMIESRPGDNEAFIQARVDYFCRMKGAEYLAYPPVVASGDRANIIHYIDNTHVAQEGDLVLMDAGCEYHGYCSDISRTWPISGKFTPAQRVLYDVVYSVQTELIQKCFEFPSLDKLYDEMTRLLGLRLKEAGVFLNQSDDHIEEWAREFCPHHVSHYLGMDVHDTPTVFRHIPLKPGMVCTIEPGIYISNENVLANPEFRGIGIRIEDDILMTENGPFVLSKSCPKHPDDIEKLRT